MGRACFDHPTHPTHGSQGPLKHSPPPAALPVLLFAQGIQLRLKGCQPSAPRPASHSGHQALSPSPHGIPLPSHWPSELWPLRWAGEGAGRAQQRSDPPLPVQSQRPRSLQSPVGRLPAHLAHSCVLRVKPSAHRTPRGSPVTRAGEVPEDPQGCRGWGERIQAQGSLRQVPCHPVHKRPLC